KIAATPNMHTTTPIVASAPIASHSRRSVLISKFQEASNSRAGRKITSTISGVIATGGSTFDQPIITPAMTQATAYGIRIHLITTAAADAIRSSVNIVSIWNTPTL